MKLKTGPKVIIGVLGVGLLFFGLRKASESGLIHGPIAKVLVPTKISLPDIKDAELANVKPLPYPSTRPASVSATQVRGEIWEWNAQADMIYANGGVNTTKGSLMEKHGVNLTLNRQDDTSQMMKDLVDCATEIHGGQTQCDKGANFVLIMGDGYPQFAAAVNPQLKKLHDKIVLIGATGFSRGEDAFMAPPAVRDNPNAARGLLVEGVLRDGDWNIAQKWEGDNNIPNNPDEHTYDPNAVNWVNAPDYNTAAADYVSGKCEDRKVVRNGKLTGEPPKHVCVNAVVTWTPGDVTVAEKKGGLVKIVSSREYSSQMPDVIVGSANFFNANHQEVNEMIAATFEAADQLKAYDKALHQAAAISAKVYNDQSEAYWYKYFKGVTEKDASGNDVDLGGSAVSNLADNKILFGLEPGYSDSYKAVYNTFAAVDMQQYPEIFKDTPIPDVKDVVDKSFLIGAEASLANADNTGATADTPDFSHTSGHVVSKKSVYVNFATGSAQPLPDGIATLDQLKDDIAITGLHVKIDGYTDNTGSSEINRNLSQARAQAVKSFFQQNSPKSFPANRFLSVQGHGPDNPIGDNSTDSGRAANRRVEVSLEE